MGLANGMARAVSSIAASHFAFYKLQICSTGLQNQAMRAAPVHWYLR